MSQIMPHARTTGSLLLVLMACSGTEPAEVATADIKADGADGPVAVATHAAVHLSWTSANAVSCLVTPGDYSGTAGSATVEDLAITTTYHLSCTGPSGDAEDSVHIGVPPGTQIVFQGGDSVSADIYVVNLDGSGLTRLTDYADADLAPSWSSDGRQIYFLSYDRDGLDGLDLYAMNADGTDQHLVFQSITSGDFWYYRRAYAVSPDGTRIALGGIGPLGNLDLFVVKVDGSERTLIADLPCDYTVPQCMYLQAVAWSPDGQRIAYSAGWQGHANFLSASIGVANADGTGQQFLPGSGSSTDPAWAPDGGRIVFSDGPTYTTYFNRPIDLQIINPDGSGGTVLVDGDADGSFNRSPTWSSDGRSIVFGRLGQLYAVEVDGTNLRPVTDAPGGAYAPDWNPAEP